ncbi:MAG: DUF2141 domain-containing protein [Terricaulis sp.]
MRRFLLIGAVSAVCVLFAGAADAGEVRVTLTGVEARGGQILAALQTEGQFLQGQGAYNQVAPSPAQPGAVVLVFPNVAPGEYALTAMHDEDGNYQMKMLESGMPAEGWAMSHGGALTGPPSFAVNKITVTDAPLSLREQIYYPYVPPAAH